MSSSVKFFSLLLASVCAFAACAPVRAETLLDANFDAETIGLSIPTGGAALGEPIATDAVSLAIVRDGDFSTPSLQFIDPSGARAQAVTFEFLNSDEIDDGIAHISARMRLGVLGNYQFELREQGGNTHDFLDVSFLDNGVVFVDTPASSANTTYNTTDEVDVDMRLDMTGRTATVTLNGVILLYDAPIGVADLGIGRVLIGNSFDIDMLGSFDLDDLFVERLDDSIFTDGFDP